MTENDFQETQSTPQAPQPDPDRPPMATWDPEVIQGLRRRPVVVDGIALVNRSVEEALTRLAEPSEEPVFLLVPTIAVSPDGQAAFMFGLIVKIKSPVLGQGALQTMTTIQALDPTPAEVERCVSEMLEGLREQRSAILAGR